MKIILAVYLSFFFTVTVYSQKLNPETTSYRYWIYFKDKGDYKPGDILEPGSEGYNLARSVLSEKAIWRRSKVLPQNLVVNYNDLPVNQEYIKYVEDCGVKYHAVSRWLNAVSIIATRKELEKIRKLPFVSKIEGVGYLEFVRYHSRSNFTNTYTQPEGLRFNYGYSWWQNQQINVPVLHNYGITGYNVTVGMCDDGYNWRKHQALRTRKVLGEYDWIFKDDSTQYQLIPNQLQNDVWDQDGHGTATMSALGGFYEGHIIGPAFDSEFYLSKSEYNGSETPVEEDYWLEAVEWMESRGAEVISSSLIYKKFDLPHNQYSYKDMNGNTTIIVRAAEHAAGLGVVVLNSMGNERQTNPPSIVSPGDGKNVIAVGAVDSSGRIAYFSSNGPTSDGRIKPDVVAMGVDVYTAVSYSSTWDTAGYTYSSGTSFSCPLTAGVCALILSAHPYLTPDQVREALKMTADRRDNPDNVYGWGLINAYDAALYWGMIASNRPFISVSDEGIIISIYFISRSKINTERVLFYYSTDGINYSSARMELSEKINETNSGKYSYVLSNDIKLSDLKFYFYAEDENTSRYAPYYAPRDFFYYNSENNSIEIFQINP